ncbi:cytochrome P450 [Nocardia sp. R7R-8]|uniref:cytochrome P450 n=1 Tax=Nocardia sp. R7R-8 TaxID=3459304 RepID=UPI00403E2B48
MTTPPAAARPDPHLAPHHGSPTEPDGDRIPLYSEEFSRNPHSMYPALRDRYGSLVPVDLAPGVPATLVIGYRTAVHILHDPDHFPSDPRLWEQTVPPDCPLLPVLQWRPNASRNSGAEHTHYRQANTAAVDAVDLYALQDTVEEIATSLIGTFCSEGNADLISRYALPLASQVINAMLGCPPEIGLQVSKALMMMFDGTNPEEGNRMLTGVVAELIALKRVEPGDDITTRLLQHPNQLDDAEVADQVVVIYGAGIEPLQNLIANSLVLILTDDRFSSDLLGGSLSTRDALDEVLFTEPPLANFCVTYPRQPILIEGIWLPAHQPVIISMAGCNADPTISSAELTGNRSHLAWGAGPHACPARSPAYLIAQTAIDQLIDALPEIQLAVPADELPWRNSLFRRAMAALPVVFPKTRR